MEDMKQTVARNISTLRKHHGMTQLDLAEKLNYSDKAVSKWERGDSLPDVLVLKNIADLFGVTVDYLITSEHPTPLPTLSDGDEPISQRRKHKFPFRVHAVITGMSVLLVWLIATLLVFIFWYTPMSSLAGKLIPFVYAVPVSAVVWLVLNSIWFNRRRNYLIISLLMWSVLASVYLTVLVFGANLWLIYALGIPGQAIIFMWSGMWAGAKKKLEGVLSKDDHKGKK